jgi:hypothetical protein
MKRFLRTMLAIVICYLAVSLLFGAYAEHAFRRELGHHLMVMGREGFVETQGFEKQMKDDPSLHRYWNILAFTPPFGWV